MGDTLLPPNAITGEVIVSLGVKIKTRKKGKGGKGDAADSSEKYERTDNPALHMVMLPPGIRGARCGNCMYYRDNHCYNPAIDREVEDIWHCPLWDHAGADHV